MGRGFQMWRNPAQLSGIYPLSESTLRRYIKDGRFGPPEGEPGEDYVLRVGNEFFVSTIADEFFRRAHVFENSEPIRARNRAELVRRLAGGVAA
jgi:hypothetical protein